MKKIVSMLLVITSIFLMLTPNVAAFSARITKPDEATYSKNNPYTKGQCTWYAWGRAREILGERPKTWQGNAGAWYWC